jgi:hypothetical protein
VQEDTEKEVSPLDTDTREIYTSERDVIRQYIMLVKRRILKSYTEITGTQFLVCLFIYNLQANP